MKKLILAAVLFTLFLSQGEAQYPLVTIRQIEQVPFDSLLVADALQRTAPARWTLQRSPYYRDTVTVVGVCVVPAKVVNFTSIGYNLLLADTGSPDLWGGLFVRANISSSGNPGDTALAIQWGALNVQAGDLVKITGYIDEFPSPDMVSQTQMVPLYNYPIEILGTVPIPPHVKKDVADFHRDVPTTSIRFSTGEPYEFMLVELTNLTVTAYLNQTNGTFFMVDDAGNTITTMDASKWFTTRGHRDPASTYALPALNTKVDTIRGYIMANSGSEAGLGYRIAPLLPGDIVYGAVLPLVSTHRRNPVVVPPDSAARISVVATKQPGGSGIASVNLLYALGSSPSFTTVQMAPKDTTYEAEIPQQPADTFVRYFIEVTDSLGQSVRLASSAFRTAGADTSQGFFFYTVLNRPLTIRDIQYTPYSNGRSAYQGASVRVGGIVTADTVHMGISPLTASGGTNAWYIQSGNQPWSGLWLATTDTIARSELAALRNGDSILVTGTVVENFDVTQLAAIQPGVTVVSSGNPVPAPVPLPTGNFGPNSANGSPLAEPYESMLVRFANASVADVYPTYADPTEFAVDDGSGPILVRRDGMNSFSNVPDDTATGKTLLVFGNRISRLDGVLYYSFNRYKITPRTNADFGPISPTSVELDANGGVPASFALEQNYPNPFNPSTSIVYGIPRSGFVSLKIYNVLGQEVRTLVSGPQSAGRYTARFDASTLSSGLYFYRIQVAPDSGPEFTQVKKMMLLK